MARINDENNMIVGRPLFGNGPSMSKAAPGSVRKQAFGELKNVMHSTVPSSVGKQIKVLSHLQIGSKVKNTPAQHQNQKIAAQASPIQTDADSDENLFDYIDHGCCTSTCQKSLEQIWSEMQTFDSVMLDGLLNFASDDILPPAEDEIIEPNGPEVPDIEPDMSHMDPFQFETDIEPPEIPSSLRFDPDDSEILSNPINFSF